MQKGIVLRKIASEDRHSILQIVNKITHFTDEEKQCALELLDAYLDNGEASGYDFLTAINAEKTLLGYVCFGKIPLTDACYDIYWIVVEPEFQDKGVGTKLLYAMEEKLTGMGARKIFVETSSQKKYLSAQNFYQKNEYRLVSNFSDFYKIGDGKLIFLKNI